MFYVGFTAGIVMGAVLFTAGVLFWRFIALPLASSSPLDAGSIGIPQIFNRRVVKKSPKSVSDEEQWKREQRTAPLDPGMG